MEDQDRLAGVWRRLWCADEADVRCRMNPVRADHTATRKGHHPALAVRASSSDAADSEGERARLEGSTAASSWAHCFELTIPAGELARLLARVETEVVLITDH